MTPPRMTPASAAKRLRVPTPAGDTATVLRPLKALSLTGGGYRGLFTAQVLVQLCRLARRDGDLRSSFDVIGGTSIGGLMAAALAVGRSPGDVLATIEAHGAKVFPHKRSRNLRRNLFGSLYDPARLAEAVDDCLGPASAQPLKDLDVALVIPAVDWASGSVELFLSGAFGAAHASGVTLRDACLATSAAPTFFPPHRVDGRAMLDGGLAANNPDTLILLEIVRRWPQALGRTHMLSIGTAGAHTVRRADDAERSGVRWAPVIADFMIEVQERMAASQARRMLGPSRYLRINHAPAGRHPAFEHLDLATDEARDRLVQAAVACATDAYDAHRAFIDRALATRRIRR